MLTMQDDLLKSLRCENGIALMFIDGEFTAASDGGARDCVNPANGEVIVGVAEGTVADAERAILAAHAAFHKGPWGESLAQDRARLLNLLADRIDERWVIATGLTGASAMLLVASTTHTFGAVTGVLVAVGALGASVNAASGRAIMAWFPGSELGLALGIRRASPRSPRRAAPDSPFCSSPARA